MDNTPFNSYLIDDRSFVAYIKREIHNLVKDRFSVKRTGEIDIIISELTSNIIKYASRGELLYRLYITNDKPVFEVLAIDDGPGIKDKALMMRDGISSAQTLGHGLGAVTRLSNTSKLYSQPEWGTIFYSKVDSEISSEISDDIYIGGLRVCYPGEVKCGDDFFVGRENGVLKLFLGDGLGHGVAASEAVTAAIRSFENNASITDPSALLRIINQDVKKTRGLVAAVVCINHDLKQMDLCGIGNISARVYSGIVLRNHNSYNGILGLNIPTTLNNSNYILEKNQTVILCSDGIKTRWDLTRYPGILKYDPLVIASAIYKDNARRNDDMTVLVAKVK